MHTNLIKIKRYYGLEKPYDFKVAIPLLLSFGLLSVVVLLALVQFGIGKLSFSTPRFNYVVYLCMGLLFTGAIARYFKISMIIFIWFFFEFALGVGSSSLRPSKDLQVNRFQYHPLLQGIPVPNYESQRGVNVQHNSLGMRGNKNAKININGNLISVYGGSTTYDVGVNQGETWVEKLNEYIGKSYVTLNFGVPGYSTSENIIQTAFYSDIEGTYPKCSIYYVGWNDIRNAHIPDLDRAYADFHLLSQLGNLQSRSIDNTHFFSPVLILLSRFASSRLDTVPLPPVFSSENAKPGSDSALEHIYLGNISTIAAINQSRGIQTVFIGQILNRDQLNSNKVYGWLPLVRDKDVWNLQSRFNNLLESKSKELGVGYIDAGVEHFNNSDFVDNGHFTASGASKFASLIANDVKKYCSSK